MAEIKPIPPQRILRVEEMRSSDRLQIESGTGSAELMFRAGHAIFERISWKSPIGIICGSGNNAGDGFVLATLLQKNGFDCRLILLSERFSPDGSFYFEQCKAARIPFCFHTPDMDLSGYQMLVDCIFGTGFHGVAEGIYAQAIDAVNRSGAYVVSVDIPSGLDGNSGLAEGSCISADITVSIGCPQPGNYLNMAKDHSGSLVCADIGIAPIGRPMYLVDSASLRGTLPPRKQFSNKGSYGYISIIGGSFLYSGAAKLANLSCAALRSGCGVSKLAVPASCSAAVLPYLLESTLVPLPDEGGFMKFSPEAFSSLLTGTASCALGMGWGNGSDNSSILRFILTSYHASLVIDADGLNTLSAMPDYLELLRNFSGKAVLTPHIKEFQRLSGLSKEEILRDPTLHVREFAAKSGVILLLKGPSTVISDGETVYVVAAGCSGMATAGSGDLLSGVLAGLFGWLPVNAMTVALGAWLCGKAGELAEKEVGAISMLASDTVRKLPSAFQILTNESEDI